MISSKGFMCLAFWNQCEDLTETLQSVLLWHCYKLNCWDNCCVVWTYLAGGSDEDWGNSSIFWILAKGKEEHGEATHFSSLSDEQADALHNVTGLEELVLAVTICSSSRDASFPPTSCISILFNGFCSTRVNTDTMNSSLLASVF